MSDKARRRAGLDYWPRLRVFEHTDWPAYLQHTERYQPAPPTRWVFSARGGRPWNQAEYRSGDHLVFGKETAGLPDDILEANQTTRIALPMVPAERSLNLACTATAAVYEAVRQLIERGDVQLDGRTRLLAPGPSPR